MKNRTIKRMLGVGAALLSLNLAASSLAETIAPVTIESLLNEMVDRENVAKFPQSNFRLKQQSSYDRRSKTPEDEKAWFANHDFNNKEKDRNFIRTEENNGRKEWVIMEHEGAGALVRTWMPDGRKNNMKNLDGLISIYLDGADKPAIEGHMFDLLNGTSLIPFPLGHKSLLSAVSFFPIPYGKSCKITLTQQPFFFVMTYREYPEGTAVKTFKMDDFKQAAATVDRTCEALLHPSNETKGEEASIAATLAPRSEESVTLPQGTGAIRTLSLKLGNYGDPAVTRSVVLKMTFDGKETVWCPVGDFFGTGIGLHPFQGWYRTVGKDGTMACRWVMPFRESAEITLVNLGDKPVDAELNAVVGDWEWDERSLYFHSAWRQQSTVPTRPYSDWNYVSLKGRGVYVGDTLTIMNPVERWWGEGDERVYVDGEKFPSIFGTGTEDYYGYSWGGRSTDFYEHAFHAQPRCNVYDQLNRKSSGEKNTLGFSTETRTRALDTMPFGTSLKLDMEVWHWEKCAMAYAVSTHWYGDADSSSNRKADPEAALKVPKIPAGKKRAATSNAFPDAIECESMKVLSKSKGMQAKPQGLKGLSGTWSGDSHLFIKGGKTGDFVEFRFPAKDAEATALVLHATRSYDFGIVRISVNGQAAGEFDLYAGKPVPSGVLKLGDFKPVDGRFTLRAEIVGKNPKSRGLRFGLDCVVVGRQ